MHPQKDGNRDIRIVEEIDTRYGEIDAAEQVHRHHGRHGHRSHAEKELSGQADEKHQVHLRRIELRTCNVLPPREVARVSGYQDQRKHCQRKR